MTYSIGAQSNSRRPLLRGGERVGDFDASMDIEMCERIARALNFLQRVAEHPTHDTPAALARLVKQAKGLVK